MTRPFKKALLCLLLILLTLVGAAAVSAQQSDDRLENSLQQAREAGISEATLKRLLALAYEKQVEPAGMANLLPVLAQCQRDNLPLEPFLSKIEEGISKRVPAYRIGQVLKTRLDDYRFTRSLLALGVGSGSEIDAAATVFHIRLTETLYCGLSREDLAHLAGVFPSASLPELSRGAEVLATLKQLCLEPQLADQIVATGMEQGYFAVEQRDFGRLVAMAKKKGLADTQIAAAALEVIKSKGSQNDLSSRLGITSQDGAHEGPQLQKTVPASGLSGRKESALAPTIGGVGRAGELQERANASREGGSVAGLEAAPTAPMVHLIGPPEGSTPVPGTAGTDLMLAAEISKIGRGPQAAANPSAVKASDSASSPSPTPSPDNSKDSRALSEKGTNRSPKAAQAGERSSQPQRNNTPTTAADPTSTPGSTADGKSVPVPGSSDGGGFERYGSSGDYYPGTTTDERPQEATVTFMAAGTVIALDLQALILTLDVHKAHRLPTGYGSTFAISRMVRVKAQSAELGAFDLDLADVAAQGDYLKVMGRILADGTCLVKRIVLPLDGAVAPVEGISWTHDTVAQESNLFAAAGTITALDAEALTVTVIVGEANQVLKQLVDTEVQFILKAGVKVSTENSSVEGLELELDDITTRTDYARFLGRKLATGDCQITHIILNVDEL